LTIKWHTIVPVNFNGRLLIPVLVTFVYACNLFTSFIYISQTFSRGLGPTAFCNVRAALLKITSEKGLQPRFKRKVNICLPACGLYKQRNHGLYPQDVTVLSVSLWQRFMGKHCVWHGEVKF
jgi:hypothetical protein